MEALGPFAKDSGPGTCSGLAVTWNSQSADLTKIPSCFCIHLVEWKDIHFSVATPQGNILHNGVMWDLRQETSYRPA